MKLLFNRKKRIFTKVLQATFLLSMLSSSSLLLAQRIPELSLGVRNGTQSSPYNNTMDNNQREWYPDNRIWVAPSRIEQQGTVIDTIANEILVPVLITNRWTTPVGITTYETSPISSFKFGLYYDGSILEFKGVQNEHPYGAREAANLGITRYNNSAGVYQPPLAEHFHLVASDESVTDYLKYFNRNLPTNANGKKVTVEGAASSFYSLDTTGTNNREVLLYLKFKVKLTTNSPTNANRRAILYFDPAYIWYNGVNVAKDNLLDLFARYDPSGVGTNTAYHNYVITRNDNMVQLDTSWGNNLILSRLSTTNMVGLQVYYNFTLGASNDWSRYIAGNYYLPGSIVLNVMNTYPQFNFTVVNLSSMLPVNNQIRRDPNDDATWILQDLITTDLPKLANTNDPNRKGSRYIDVDISPNSRMDEIIIETDQEWLRVQSINDISNNIGSKFNGIQRRAFVLRIDNTITEGYNPFPLSGETVQASRRFRLNIDCDPNGLQGGLYTGYVTFKAKNDHYKTTRIEVKFLVFENPQEVTSTQPSPANSVLPYGIKLKLSPFNATRPELTKTLIMGTGERATDYADTLYGEYAEYNVLGINSRGGIEEFDARFFLDTTNGLHSSPNNNPTSPEYQLWKRLVDNGFGDFAQNEGSKRSNSRDIRSLNTNAKSHVYLVKYRYRNETTPDFFPIVLEWDRSELMASSSIYLKYISNGSEYITDMLTEGTSIGGNRYTFTFHDRNVQEFRIEYTVGIENLEDLLDNFGNPIIMPDGWNFVSLPLKPANTYYSYIFKEIKNAPYWWFQDGWQQVTNGILQPGMGYFVKYPSEVDKRFSGARFRLISSNTYPVRLYGGQLNTIDGSYSGGWNAIGALSMPVPSDNITFEQYVAGKIADVAYTRGAGVWAYTMNKGYDQVPMLLPGKGYWIKVNAPSYLRLEYYGQKQVIGEIPPAITNKVAGFDKINVADNAQNSTNIYAANNVSCENFQLPPLPPEGLFDVRFIQGSYVANYDNAVVSLRGVKYPVALNFENPRANYTVVDADNGYVFGTVKAGSNQNVIINDLKFNRLKLLVEVADETFFVTVANNPVTENSAKVSFGINANANVTLAVYNTLGNEVVNLEVGNLEKGVHNREINISDLVSGSYIVRLIAGNESKIFRMNVIR